MRANARCRYCFFGDGALKTWKLTLEYDGSRYAGWQEQTNARAIANELRRAAEEVLGARVELTGAGRTDAGVHATGQVAHLKAATRRAFAPPQLSRLLNEKLPADIAVVALSEAPPKFHARHSAIARVYEYRYSTRKTAFDKKFVWWIKEPLDLDAMRAAAAAVPGRHNFSLFRAVDPSKPRESPLVEVHNASIRCADALVVFEIEASHFLWRMVRRLAGTLARVGLGQITPAQFAQLLEARPVKGCDPAEWTAPGSGLFLTKVKYP
jgi:tRNA pseudouridine38-40 synthase